VASSHNNNIKNYDVYHYITNNHKVSTESELPHLVDDVDNRESSTDVGYPTDSDRAIESATKNDNAIESATESNHDIDSATEIDHDIDIATDHEVDDENHIYRTSEGNNGVDSDTESNESIGSDTEYPINDVTEINTSDDIAIDNSNIVDNIADNNNIYINSDIFTEKSNSNESFFHLDDIGVEDDTVITESILDFNGSNEVNVTDEDTGVDEDEPQSGTAEFEANTERFFHLDGLGLEEDGSVTDMYGNVITSQPLSDYEQGPENNIEK